METVNEMKRVLGVNFETLQLKLGAASAANRSLETVNAKSAELNQLLGTLAINGQCGHRGVLSPIGFEQERCKPREAMLEPLQSSVDCNGNKVQPQRQPRPFLRKGEGLRRFEPKAKIQEEALQQCDKKRYRKKKVIETTLPASTSIGWRPAIRNPQKGANELLKEKMKVSNNRRYEDEEEKATTTTAFNVDDYISQLDNFIANNFESSPTKDDELATPPTSFKQLPVHNKKVEPNSDTSKSLNLEDFAFLFQQQQHRPNLFEQIPRLERRLSNLLTLRAHIHRLKVESQTKEKKKKEESEQETAILHRIDSLQQELKGIDDRLKTISIEQKPEPLTTKSTCDYVMPNGDNVMLSTDKTIVYQHATSGVTQTIHPDGLKVINFAATGQVERRYPDGRREIDYPDGQKRLIQPDGSEETRLTDGSVITFLANGVERVQYADGTIELKTKNFTKRENPNGDVRTKYFNGCEETAYANGRIRFKDERGRVLYDYRPKVCAP